MKVVYRLHVDQRFQIPLAAENHPLTIKEHKFVSVIEWNNENNYLTDVIINILHQPINPNGSIAPPPEAEKKAFQLAVYISNNILQQVGLDAINPHDITMGSPVIYPESEEEAKEFSVRTQIAGASLVMPYNILGKFDVNRINTNMKYAKAFGFYADSMRSRDPLTTYELLYRVIESFFRNPVNQAPSYIHKHHSVYKNTSWHDVRNMIKELKNYRHRITHPHGTGAGCPLDRHDLGAWNQVQEILPTIQQIARWLLDHPPP